LRYLVILNAAVLALSATIALCLGVVVLLYAFNQGLSARVDAEMPALVASTATFSLVSAVVAVALFGLVKRRPWLWICQGAAAVTVVACTLYLTRLYT
jgi:hypothetical protein